MSWAYEKLYSYKALFESKLQGQLSPKQPPRRGIEPRSPAWQAGILTTVLSRMKWYIAEFCKTLHEKGKRRFWWIEGFQPANVDILYIKTMEIDRSSISFGEKREFSLKNESWWKIGFSIGKMENGPKKRVCRGDEGPKLSWDVEWCPRIDLRSFREFSWFSRT